MLLAARLARSLHACSTSGRARSLLPPPAGARRAAPTANWGAATATAVNSNVARSASCAAAASSADRIDPPDVRKLAAMATIAVTDEEVAAWEPTLQKIAGWFDQLQAVDVEGVPPATDAGVGGGSLRADEVDTSLAGAEDALAQAPDREGGFVRVPKV